MSHAIIERNAVCCEGNKKFLARLRKFYQFYNGDSRSDTEVGQVGLWLPWILLKSIVFDSAAKAMAEPSYIMNIQTYSYVSSVLDPVNFISY